VAGTGGFGQTLPASPVAALRRMPEATTASQIQVSDESKLERRPTHPLAHDSSGGVRRDRWRTWAPDALMAAVLGTVAFIARRGGLPTDGLWHDDAWVVFGATKGSLSNLFTVGADHPGFTLVLMAWTRLGGSFESTAYPALIAGTLGPPALYLALRYAGIARSISALLGATLAAANIHIMYSGRVKTYTIDVLIVLGLVVAVASLANTRWRWRTAGAWIITATVLASVSGFAFLATAAAGIVLLLHPTSDRRVRFVAVGAQAMLQLFLFQATQRTYSSHELERFWARRHDAYLDFDVNPVRFGSEILEHLGRVAHVFPGDIGWWASLCLFVALLGLLGAALTNRSSASAVRARYLLIILVVAILGGVLDKFPFGPARGGAGVFAATYSRGERASLWLIPLLAVGLAVAVQALRGLGADRRWLRVGFDVVLYLIAAIVVIGAVGHDAPQYARPGSESAVKFIESELGHDDALLVIQGGHYQFALESDFDASIRPRPAESIGFVPVFADPRVHVVEFPFDRPVPVRVPRRIREAISGVDGVIVYSGSGIFGLQFFTQVPVLLDEGFRRQATFRFGAEYVSIWKRSLDRTSPR
jgi:hypothetical protein